jgi:hypothetical protein
VAGEKTASRAGFSHTRVANVPSLDSFPVRAQGRQRIEPSKGSSPPGKNGRGLFSFFCLSRYFGLSLRLFRQRETCCWRHAGLILRLLPGK